MPQNRQPDAKPEETTMPQQQTESLFTLYEPPKRMQRGTVKH